MRAKKQTPIYTGTDTSAVIPLDTFIHANSEPWYDLENEDIFDNDIDPKRVSKADNTMFNAGQNT